jgi:hypothetical protein
VFAVCKLLLVLLIGTSRCDLVRAIRANNNFSSVFWFGEERAGLRANLLSDDWVCFLRLLENGCSPNLDLRKEVTLVHLWASLRTLTDLPVCLATHTPQESRPTAAAPAAPHPQILQPQPPVAVVQKGGTTRANRLQGDGKTLATKRMKT